MSRIKKINIYDSELFWLNQPNAYARLYMKYDWFKMPRAAFVAKYTKEYWDSRLDGKKAAILSVITPLWNEMGSEEKYEVITQLTVEMHYTDAFNVLLDVQQVFGGNFIEQTIEATYRMTAKRNWKTNYFKAFGLVTGKAGF